MLHHAAKIGQEHCNGCIGCLTLQLSLPPATITVFLTWRQHAATILTWRARNTVVAGLFYGPDAFLVTQTNGINTLKAKNNSAKI